MKKILFLLLITSIIFSSCHKEDIKPDNTPPVITIIKPIQNQIFSFNDTIKIEIDIIDASNLKSVVIGLKDNNGNVIWHPNEQLVLNSSSFHYSGYAINTQATATICYLEIIASDEFDNYGGKNSTIQCTGTTSLTNAIDYTGSLLYFTDIVHILDQAALTGNYGSCATVNTSAFNSGNNDTITVDFGPSNCMDIFGRNKRGKIICIYNHGFNDSLTYKQISFNNYFVNDIQLTGTASITNNGHSTVGYRWYAFTNNGTMELTSGESLPITNNLSLLRISGESTSTFSDDVWNIFGTSLGTDRFGQFFSATNSMATPVQRNLNCGWFSQGTIDVTPQGSSSRPINFGNGTCDNQGTITIGLNNYWFTML